jgi:hypothetical protein
MRKDETAVSVSMTRRPVAKQQDNHSILTTTKTPTECREYGGATITTRSCIMMRRHKTTFVSPSKEEIRRRLFQSPQKPRFFVPSHSGSSWRLSRPAILALVCVSVVILLGVHLFLFQVLLWETAIERDIAIHAPSDTKRLSKNKRLSKDASEPTLRGSHPSLKQDAKNKRELEPLQPIDLEQYTIRMNTWRRPEQLLISVKHHASCPGVAQIQIVWCDKEEEPPAELYNYTNVVIERHDTNSLNERFNILEPTPTRGILSIDDDLLRPCEAIDAGFFKWTKSPHRMVGFDARIHVENEDGTWKYGYMR